MLTVNPQSGVGESPPRQYLMLQPASWELYEKLLEEIGDRPIRVSYNRGRLEIMAPLQEHEKWLKSDGTYVPAARSAAFPMISLPLMESYLKRAMETDTHSLMRQFREEIRQIGK